MVSVDTTSDGGIPLSNTQIRIESEIEMQAYLTDLRYAINNGAQVSFQAEWQVDQNRDVRYTNRFTVADLFPNENPVDALKRELLTLKIEEYMRTVKDLRFPKKSEMREFGKVYNGKGDVYIVFGQQLNNHWKNAGFQPFLFRRSARK